VLGQCIAALSKLKPKGVGGVVPYRNSQLTWLLKVRAQWHRRAAANGKSGSKQPSRQQAAPEAV
jgi:hypothetical protein